MSEQEGLDSVVLFQGEVRQPVGPALFFPSEYVTLGFLSQRWFAVVVWGFEAGRVNRSSRLSAFSLESVASGRFLYQKRNQLLDAVGLDSSFLTTWSSRWLGEADSESFYRLLSLPPLCLV